MNVEQSAFIRVDPRLNLLRFKQDMRCQMKKTKEPLLLTVNGKAAIVVHDTGRPVEDFFIEFLAKE